MKSKIVIIIMIKLQIKTKILRHFIKNIISQCFLFHLIIVPVVGWALEEDSRHLDWQYE